jgi:hypothetical protein
MTVLLPKPRTDYLKISLAFQREKLWNSLKIMTRGGKQTLEFLRILYEL